jgi:DNA-binding MarR family transcriptional regulator
MILNKPENSADLRQQAERLYKALTEIQRPYHRDNFDGRIELTLPQLRTLMTLAANGRCSMGDLGKSTGYHLSALTGIIGRLSRKKYVSRIRDKNDRRVVKVVLTEKGRKLTSRISTKIVNRTSEMLSRIDDESRENLISLIEKIAINLKRP